MFSEVFLFILGENVSENRLGDMPKNVGENPN